MVIYLNFNKLLVIALLSAMSSFTTISAKENNDLAPEVTAEEAAISFWELPYLENAFIDTMPAEREDGLVVSSMVANGGNKAMMVKLAQEIAGKQYGKLDSLLVARQGKLIFESYYLRGRVNLAHGQASAVKAYTSLALGRAIQLGYLTMADLDKPLIHFLKDLDREKLVQGADTITLHKALTMHGGLSLSEEQSKALEKPASKLKGQGFVQTLLEQSAPITPKSQIYQYGNYNPMLVMTVIDAVVPGSAKEFIKHEILDKLAITNYSWDEHVSGLPEAGWRVSMTSRDMLKLGFLVANKGKWQGEQLISADYLAKATSGLVKPTQDWMPDNYRYGYFWYQTVMTVDDKSYDATFAWGGGGQRVIVIADLDLTIVITAHDREDQIMAQISNTVIPAFAEKGKNHDSNVLVNSPKIKIDSI
ncbi:hypothetical protein tinsulaeT_27960 [Thalassotalea insulae]|uniref:Beta-lactamase-related domain-containing protein n=1 Tax=Thalassotalea insulae TaxID=2056778 RepID=A0ABQ6GXV0_9GAMM|nr:serine hydrolase [Thalassotalea insulae]GLX79456.1 hypothetical protein tinsulaeT_27960 [Thalassotalea insulae]